MAELPEISLSEPFRSSVTEPTLTLPPATIAQLAERFEDAPVFADIAKALDYKTMQPRQDYLPITLSEVVRPAITYLP